MQQVQSQNDKMVPIDTSGDPVEVELKEDEKKEGYKKGRSQKRRS